MAILLGPINNLSRYGFDKNDTKGNNISSVHEFSKIIGHKNIKKLTHFCESIFNIIILCSPDKKQKIKK